MMNDSYLAQAKTLKLHGLIAHWDEVLESDWLPKLLAWEEQEKTQRSLQRRLTSSHINTFKPLTDFDWQWPKECDKGAIIGLLDLNFISEESNVILSGPNGVGKTMIAANIAHQAVMHGYNVLFTTAGEMLNELAAQDGDNALRRRIKHYAKPDLLVVDEVGYLSYSNRHADLFFEIISRRYQHKPTVITTNKPFSEWADLFPNAACVVSLIDRLVHHSEIINIDADSYRLKEAKERAAKKRTSRSKKTEK